MAKILNPQQIPLKLMQAAASQLHKALKRDLKKIEKACRQTTIDILQKSDFYVDMLYGTQLRGEFGIPNGQEQQVMNAVVNAVSDDTYLEYDKITATNNSFQGGLTLGIGTNAWSKLLSLPKGVVQTAKGQLLPWLSWSITRGDSIIILGYDVFFQNGFGRSGLAIMKEGHTVWRVPSKFSGTINNNWISRAIIKNIQQYADTLQIGIENAVNSI